MGGNQDEVMLSSEGGGYKIKVGEMTEIKEKCLRQNGQQMRRNTWKYTRGRERVMRVYLHSPVDSIKKRYCDFGWENLTCQKEERCTPVPEWRGK